MSEPITFTRVSGLPAGMSFHVDGVTTQSGHDYTKLATKGISNGSWTGTSHQLSMTLVNPTAALVEMEVTTAGRTPSGACLDGSPVARGASAADFQAATDSSWFFDPGAGLLHIKGRQGSSASQLVATFTS
jgi:hypothetical protein